MAKNITASGSVDIADNLDGVAIQVNAALTGTITVQAGGTAVAIITNPTVGSFFRYGGLRGQGKVTVNPSATCDITVSPLQRLA